MRTAVFVELICAGLGTSAFAETVQITGSIEAIASGGDEGRTLRAVIRNSGVDLLDSCPEHYAYVGGGDPQFSAMKDAITGLYFSGGLAEFTIATDDAGWCRISQLTPAS